MEHLGEVIPLWPGIRREPSAEGVTFKRLADEWLEVAAREHACPANGRRHVDHLSALWRLTEAELRPRVVRQALAELAQKLGPSTRNKVRGTGRQIIQEAILNDRWMGPNPFDAVPRAKETEFTHRILSLDECRAVLPLLCAVRRREAYAELYLGPRPGELKALHRTDVDLHAGTIHIHRSNGRDRTKTGKERLIPIPGGFLPHLEEALRLSPPGCHLVFPGADGKRLREDFKHSRALQTALGRAGLVSSYSFICRRKGCGFRAEGMEHEPRCPRCNMVLWKSARPLRVRWYDLRHSSATLHTQAGANPLAVQLLLGHAPESLTQSLYTHLTREDLRRELSKLAI